ncbi:hypothetical protein OHB26_22240 [Nocardia sp. NBC_01503]|uniref:hypothetical protein n=1 Tax=Nocardia sp. NBC_01503 TaxID=2975997 RepID=UPI002E7BE0D6|nr:hypothetical protein [Nocardia sp. NBC_01503]WTL29694.1 hypothetical protein OHB26_22240 [Nocardia sp. NBC_01503]
MAIENAAAPWVPDACTLPTVEQPTRVAEFDQLFATAVGAITRPTSTSLELTLPAEAEAAARDLAARESQCCAFFTFDFETGTAGTTMRIGVPAGQVAILDALAARAPAE